MNIWNKIETAPEAATETSWRRLVGKDLFDTVANICLLATTRLVETTDTQEESAKRYLLYKQIPLVAEFYDDDVSGNVPIWQRPKGAQLRARLLDGDIKHLVIAKLDRLGRRASDLLSTLEFLDGLGVILHIVDLGGDSLTTQGAAGRLMFTVLAGMAQFERELICDRIQTKLDLKKSDAAQVKALTLIDNLPRRTAMICTTNRPLKDMETRYQRRFKYTEIKRPGFEDIQALLQRWPMPAAIAKMIAVNCCGNVGLAMNEAEEWLQTQPVEAAA